MLSVSLAGALECQMRVNDVFLRCVFERYDAVCHVRSTLKKPSRRSSSCSCLGQHHEHDKGHRDENEQAPKTRKTIRETTLEMRETVRQKTA